MARKSYENMVAYNEKDYCNKSLSDVLRWGYEFTSVAGITQFKSTDCKTSKCFWFVITIAAALATSFTVFKAFSSYYKYDTVTTVGIKSEITTEFPSVTICNQNRVHCRNLYNHIRNCTKDGNKCERKDIYCNIFIMSHCIVSLKYASRFENANETHFDPVCIDDSWLKRNETGANNTQIEGCANDSKLIQEGGPYHSKRITKNDFYDAYLKLTKEDVITIAHQPSDMIKYCEYADNTMKESCDELIKGSVKMFGPATGVCYSFNFIGLNKNKKPAPVVYGGQEFGLQLIIDIEEGYYMRNALTPSSGARVVVEHSSKTPSIISKGVLVYPGTETNIGVQRTHIKRLKLPYESMCTNEYLEEKMKSYAGNISYSSRNCRGLCYLDKIFTKCNCMHPILVEGYHIDIWFNKVSKNVTSCSLAPDSYDFKCLINLTDWDTLTTDDICSCYPECSEIRYKIQTSANSWPNSGMWPQMLEDYNITYKSQTFTEQAHLTHAINGGDCSNPLKSLGAKQELEDYRSKNFLKINVFYESLDKEVITEIPQYPSIADFLNTLGGALSLFLGASFVQILEILEIILRSFYVSIF